MTDEPSLLATLFTEEEYIEGAKTTIGKSGWIQRTHKTIRWIFHRYISLGGKAKKLYNELLAMPVLFPSFDPEVDPRNTTRLLLRAVPGGYHISFTGLLYLLTNVVYIGWWLRTKGSI